VADRQRTHSRPGTRTKRTQAALDPLDLKILAALQANARTPSAALARRTGLSPAGLQKRLHRLEVRGVIERYTTVVNREAVGLDLLCFVHVRLAHHRATDLRRFPERIARIPEVMECHFLTGEADYLLKVVVANHAALEQFLFEKLMKVEGVDRIRTSIVLKDIKSSTILPLSSLA
jgi:Lrp/AsnC family leucine-responsive transcriptional regulator